MKIRNIGLAVGMVWLLGVTLPAGAQVFTLQHNFTNTPDGANPRQPVWSNGFFYGATANGGTNGYGMLYEFNPNGSVFSTVYDFTGATNDGDTPNGLVVAGNMIYGTTTYAGTNYVGMIYAVNTNGSGFTPLYSFGPPPDGYTPLAGLILNGTTLYGTASSGGTNGGGTLFAINTDGTGYTILHWFTNTPDGYLPQSELLLSGGTLFGTTTYGGTNGFGTVFSVSTNGTGYTILRSFTNGPDANYPYGGLVLNSGILYGTSSGGGSNTTGTIFAINTNGTGYTILHHFSAIAGNLDGWQPDDTLTSSGGSLYGTTSQGGTGGLGTVFQINPDGTGYTVLKNFTNSPADGADPVDGVVLLGTTVWGTTYSGGSGSAGILYSLLLSPVITQQPQSVTVTNGSPASFTVSATDDTVTNYQWYFNTNTVLTGQTSNSLNFASAATNNAGTYTVVVSDDFGAVTSSPAVLTVVSKPVITTQPQNLTITNNNPASFTVSAFGDGVLAYQWYFNTNTLLAGQTSNSLNFASATTNNAGTYAVVVSNYVGVVTSSPAVLTVMVVPPVPTITRQPQNYTVTNGFSASFTNVASSTIPLYYQWYFNTNTSVAGGTNSILTLTSATTGEAGYYSVVVSNTSGSVTSSAAKLTVISTLPIILRQPQGLTVTNGSPASFSVSAAGKIPLRYQWYTNTVATAHALAGKTNNTLTFLSASNNLAGNYLVVITNSLGRATSSPALLIVLTTPVITLQPQSVTVINGNPVTFTAAAAGAGVLKFQWFFGTNLPPTHTNIFIIGATNLTFTFTNAITNLHGAYSVRVTNAFGAVTSSFALLTISNRPNLLSSAFNPANGSFSLALANIAHSTNRLWASTNLASTNFWRPIATNVMATNGLWFFTDPNTARTNPARFYRFSTP